MNIVVQSSAEANSRHTRVLDGNRVLLSIRGTESEGALALHMALVSHTIAEYLAARRAE